MSSDAAPNLPAPSDASIKHTPIVSIVIGMAGTGKTTLMQRINHHCVENNLRAYYINLDPAVKSVPFAANIDIRDTVNYKEVMQQYGLGPNGGILTALNLFATRFDQVIEILERRADEFDHIFIDTPGQIEAFTWSAGGQIILELLANSFPTTILYITDTPRCQSTTTFMSNMLYACSVLFKSKLPLICVFNKIDSVPFAFAQGWMADFETFQDALDGDKEEYLTSLNRSLSLVMDEFYRTIKSVGVSALTGEGMEGLIVEIAAAAVEYTEVYLPELERRAEEKRVRESRQQSGDMARLLTDLRLGAQENAAAAGGGDAGGGSSGPQSM